MNRPISFLREIDSVIAGIAGFILIYIWTRHSGIGVSPDSIVYMSTAANIRHHKRRSGDVGARIRETFDKPRGHRIAHQRHDNRYRRRCLLKGEQRLCVRAYNHVNLEPDELSRQLEKALVPCMYSRIDIPP